MAKFQYKNAPAYWNQDNVDRTRRNPKYVIREDGVTIGSVYNRPGSGWWNNEDDHSFPTREAAAEALNRRQPDYQQLQEQQAQQAVADLVALHTELEGTE